MVFHVAMLAAITMIAEVVSRLIPSPVNTTGDEDTTGKSAPDSLLDLRSNTTIQTTKWIYSKAPNSLLFDFCELNMRKDHILPLIRASLPSNIVASIRPIGDLLAEITIRQDQDETNSLHKQVHSILKNKGLHVKDRNIWLKPTQALIADPNLVFWHLRLTEYPISMKDSLYKKKITDTVESSFSKKDKSNPGKSVLVVDTDNVYFSGYYGADRNSKHCAINILAKEYTVIPPPSINPIRKLIYVPFLKRYLPIEISLVK
ncbi:hypothetical protein PS15p_211500 [Mucor circinelloides]